MFLRVQYNRANSYAAMQATFVQLDIFKVTKLLLVNSLSAERVGSLLFARTFKTTLVPRTKQPAFSCFANCIYTYKYCSQRIFNKIKQNEKHKMCVSSAMHHFAITFL